ncbi:hypothetical protein N9X12_04885 [Alphaproteobacteria bacterium]|nr:hypothetical protein [Alphaproteobacteria bacterium]
MDIVKKLSFEVSLEQTLDDLKTLSTATHELTDRIEMRVRKSLQPADKLKSKKPKKAKQPKVNPFPSVTPPPSPPQNALPTANPVTTSAISAGDYERIRQDFTPQKKSLNPIKPQKPF